MALSQNMGQGTKGGRMPWPHRSESWDNCPEAHALWGGLDCS